MKNGKAPGSDTIPAKILKTDLYTSASILTPLFQKIWQEEQFSREWKESIVTSLYYVPVPRCYAARCGKKENHLWEYFVNDKECFVNRADKGV